MRDDPNTDRPHWIHVIKVRTQAEPVGWSGTELAKQSPAFAEGCPLSSYVLKLYITGKTLKAETAITNLRRICDEELGGQYHLEIIDVLENPQQAEDDKILATPTLIKHLPPPLRRVIGDLSDKHKVLLGLEVRSSPLSSPPPT